MARKVDLYRVFIASPGGLEHERKVFHDLIQECNESTAVQRGALFFPVGWEDTLGGMGRPQEIINKEIRTCDYFVMLLWDKWGTPPDQPSRTSFSSGTEEEFSVAQRCLSETSSPMRDIVVFFKAVDPGKLSDPGDQLKKVLALRKQLELWKTVLFETFDAPTAFAQKLSRHLHRWVFDHDRFISATRYTGPERRARQEKRIVVAGPPSALDLAIPLSQIFAPHERQHVGQSSVRVAAEELVKQGHLTDAEVLFAKASANDSSPEVFRDYGDFLLSLGRLRQAEELFTRLLSISEFAGDKWKAVAFGRIGLVHRKRGQLNDAERMHRAALEIHERLGNSLGVATDLRDLGQIYRRRGDLDESEKAHRQALDIFTRANCDAEVAVQYSNLALIARLRGDLDNAERFHRWALTTFEHHDDQQGMALQYGNLGTIYRLRGDLSGAEEMHKKALGINERSGIPEGIAIQLGNIAVIYVAQAKFQEADDLLRRSLAINEQLGRMEGVASDYRDLGSLECKRGDIVTATTLWIRSRDLFKMIGMKLEAEKVSALLEAEAAFSGHGRAECVNDFERPARLN